MLPVGVPGLAVKVATPLSVWHVDESVGPALPVLRGGAAGGGGGPGTDKRP